MGEDEEEVEVMIGRGNEGRKIERGGGVGRRES
jgi:hypothetical protein